MKKVLYIAVAIVFAVFITACTKAEPYTVRTDFEDGAYAVHQYASQQDERPQKVIVYHPAGNVDYEITYEYTKDGRPLSMVQTDSDGSEDYRTDYEYNADDILVKKTVYKYGFVNEVTEYNPSGTAAKATFYDPFGKIESYTEFTYDENDNIISYAKYDANGRINSEGKYTQEDGLVMYHYIYDENGEILDIYINGEKQQ